MHLPSGAYLIVVSNRPGHQALEVYKRRWQIEVLFEALKSRGFNFEETRLREAKRLETLCGVLAIAFCWAYHVGAWHNKGQTDCAQDASEACEEPCFAMDSTAFAEPSSMRQTRESSLSRS